MRLPIVRPFNRPSSLHKQPNGKLPSKLLHKVGPSGFLEANTARAFLALAAAMREVGFNLTYTYGGCYRSYYSQLALFKRRYTQSFDPKRNTTSSQRTFEGRRWYKRKGVAAAASPGSSNHGYGIAVDTALDNDPSDGVGPDDAQYIGPAIKWMVANVDKFGFSYELQSEPWHIRYVLGDTIPDAVLAFEGKALGLQPADRIEAEVKDDKGADKKLAGFPPYDPSRGLYSLWPLNGDKIELKAYVEAQPVVYLQDVLAFEAAQPIASDGQFGDKTDTAVKHFQSWFGLKVDGIVGPKTWAVVDKLATTAKARRK